MRAVRVSFIALLCVGHFVSALADFSDVPPDMPAAPPKPNLIKLPTPSPTPTPAEGPATTPPISPVSGVPTGTATTTATPTPQPPKQGGGDFLSGSAFTDVKHDNTLPIGMESQALKGSREKNVLKLIDKVTVTQGDLTIKSQYMDIYSLPNTTKPSRVVATKDVYVQKVANPATKELIEAWADEMHYSLETGIMLLKSKAKVKRGANCTVMGDILEYNLKEGTLSGRLIRGSCVPPPKGPTPQPTTGK